VELCDVEQLFDTELETSLLRSWRGYCGGGVL